MALRVLSKELQEFVINELNEDPERIEDELKAIRKWAEDKPHIRLKPDDQWLLSFLRSCAHNLQIVKHRLDLLYTLRPITPEFFSNRDPFAPEIQEILQMGAILPLPKLPLPVAPCMALMRIEPADPRRHRLEDGVRLVSMHLDLARHEQDCACICGIQLLFDVKGLTVRHLVQVTPTIIKKGIKCFYEAYPSKVKGIHVINAPAIAYVAFNAFKYLLNSKLLNLIRFYKDEDMNKLYQLMPLSILPKEYGGGGPTLQELTVAAKEKVESYRDWFAEDAQYFDQKPGTSKNRSTAKNSRSRTTFADLSEID